jgi:hypothetical protein
MLFFRHFANGDQEKINHLVLETSFVQILQHNHIKMVQLLWLYCCRDIYVNTQLPNFEQSPEYIRWQNLLEICGIQLPQNYEIVDPISIAISLLNVPLSNNSPIVSAGRNLFQGLRGFLLTGNGQTSGLPNLFQFAMLYMLRTGIRRDFIQAIIINTVEFEFSNFNFVSPILVNAVIDEAIHLYQNNTVTDVKAVRVIIRVINNYQTILDTPQIWHNLDIFSQQVLADGILRQFNADADLSAIRIIEHYNMDVNMRISSIYILPPQIQHTRAEFTFLEAALYYKQPQIALYLIERGAEITTSAINSILNSTVVNPALIKHLLTTGKISENELGRIGNNMNPDTIESRRILNDWKKMKTSYVLDKVNPHLLTHGINDFNTYG